MKPLWLLLAAIGAVAIILIVNHDAGTVFGVENHDFASLAFYGLWGVLVASAIVPARGKWREAARNLVLWLAIILALMAGYLYRYELQDAVSRMSAGLIPGSPISQTATNGKAQVTLLRTDGGQFTARGEANGAGVGFLVDTGASIVVLTERDARSAGFDTGALSYDFPVSTANGRTTAAKIELETLAIGSIVRRKVRAMVAHESALETSLLGMNFLSQLTSFEFRGDRLVLTD